MTETLSPQFFHRYSTLSKSGNKQKRNFTLCRHQPHCDFSSAIVEAENMQESRNHGIWRLCRHSRAREAESTSIPNAWSHCKVKEAPGRLCELVSRLYDQSVVQGPGAFHKAAQAALPIHESGQMTFLVDDVIELGDDCIKLDHSANLKAQ